MTNFDAIVIGAGVAGITAASELGRNGYKTAVLEYDSPGGALLHARKLDNISFIAKGLNGESLRNHFIEYVKNSPFIMIYERAESVEKHGNLFTVNADCTLITKTVIIATGLKPLYPVLPDFLLPFHHKGWSDPEKNAGILIVGGGDIAFDHALNLADRGFKVSIMHRSAPRANNALMNEVKEKNISCFVGEIDELISYKGEHFLHLSGNSKFNCLILHTGRVPEFPKIREDSYEFPANCFFTGIETPVAGLFFAGDVILHSERNAVCAASDGLVASKLAMKYINEMEI